MPGTVNLPEIPEPNKLQMCNYSIHFYIVEISREKYKSNNRTNKNHT